MAAAVRRAAAPPDQQPRHTPAVAVTLVLGLTALGAPLGLLWAALAPDTPVLKTAEGAIYAQPQPEQPIAADGWFSLLGLGFGVLAAIAVWTLLRRRRGPVGLVATTVGALGTALVAWQLGRRIGLDGYQRLLASAPAGTPFDKPADLRAGGIERVLGVLPLPYGNLLLPAFAAAVTYTLLAGWSRWPSLRPEPEPDWPTGPEVAGWPGPVVTDRPDGPIGIAPPTGTTVPDRPDGYRDWDRPDAYDRQDRPDAHGRQDRPDAYGDQDRPGVDSVGTGPVLAGCRAGSVGGRRGGQLRQRHRNRPHLTQQGRLAIEQPQLGAEPGGGVVDGEQPLPVRHGQHGGGRHQVRQHRRVLRQLLGQLLAGRPGSGPGTAGRPRSPGPPAAPPTSSGPVGSGSHSTSAVR